MDTRTDELLRALIRILEELELRYFVTGSLEDRHRLADR